MGGSGVCVYVHGDDDVMTALIATCLTYFLKSYTVKHTTPTMISSFAPVQPLGAAILAFIFLSMVPTVGQWIGGPIIVLGMYGILHARNNEVKAELAIAQRSTVPVATITTPLTISK